MHLTAIPRRPLVLLSPPTGSLTTVDPVRSGVKTGSSPRPRAEPASGPSSRTTGTVSDGPLQVSAAVRQPGEHYPRRPGRANRAVLRRRDRPTERPPKTAVPLASDRTEPIGRTRATRRRLGRGPTGPRPEPDGASRGTATAASGGPRGTAGAGGTGSGGPRTGSAPASGRAARSASRARRARLPPPSSPGRALRDRAATTGGSAPEPGRDDPVDDRTRRARPSPATPRRARDERAGPCGTGPDDEDEKKGRGASREAGPSPGTIVRGAVAAPGTRISTCRPCRRHRPERRASARA